MDIMQIKSSLMRGFISKMLGKVIYDKFGYKIKVNVNDIDLKINDEKATVQLNAGFEMDINELKRFTKLIDDYKRRFFHETFSNRMLLSL